MVDREKVIEALEACVLKDPDDSRDCRHCPRCNYGAFITTSCINGVMADALALLKSQEPRDDDADFMTHIICEICDYAVKNEMEPNDTLLTIADNIKTLLKISTFNNWKVNERRDGNV